MLGPQSFEVCFHDCIPHIIWRKHRQKGPCPYGHRALSTALHAVDGAGTDLGWFRVVLAVSCRATQPALTQRLGRPVSAFGDDPLAGSVPIERSTTFPPIEISELRARIAKLGHALTRSNSRRTSHPAFTSTRKGQGRGRNLQEDRSEYRPTCRDDKAEC